LSISEYAFQSVVGPGAIGQCNSPLSNGQKFTYQSATASGDWSTATTTITVADASVYGVHLNGYIFGTTSSSPTAMTTSANSTSSTGTTSSTSTSATSSPTGGASSGLSSGAKAGIGVGVTIGAIGVLSLIAAWLLIRRHRRKAEYTMELAGNAGPLPPKSSSVEGGYSSAPTELPVVQSSRPMVAPVELSGEPM
jgi:hypothetical protein